MPGDDASSPVGLVEPDGSEVENNPRRSHHRGESGAALTHRQRMALPPSQRPDLAYSAYCSQKAALRRLMAKPWAACAIASLPTCVPGATAEEIAEEVRSMERLRTLGCWVAGVFEQLREAGFNIHKNGVAEPRWYWLPEEWTREFVSYLWEKAKKTGRTA